MKYIFKKATSFMVQLINDLLLFITIMIAITFFYNLYKTYSLGKQFSNCQEYKEYLEKEISKKREIKSKCLNKCNEDCNNEANKRITQDKHLEQCNLDKLAKTKI